MEDTLIFSFIQRVFSHSEHWKQQGLCECLSTKMKWPAAVQMDTLQSHDKAWCYCKEKKINPDFKISSVPEHLNCFGRGFQKWGTEKKRKDCSPILGEIFGFNGTVLSRLDRRFLVEVYLFKLTVSIQGFAHNSAYLINNAFLSKQLVHLMQKLRCKVIFFSFFKINRAD